MSQIFFWIGRFDESRKLEPYFLLFSYYPRGPSNFLSGQSGKSCWKIDRCLEELPLGKGSLPFQLFPAFSSSFQKNPFIFSTHSELMRQTDVPLLVHRGREWY